MSDPAPPVTPPPVVVPAMPVVDYYATGPMPPPAPTAESQRIESIDVLRGVAVMGILFVNIQYMAKPFQEMEALNWRTMPRLDGIARLIVQLFFEMKFITLFSFLFGAGLAIMMLRLESTGRPFVSIYVRRLLVLLGIGIFHGVFLWYGDILAVYALLGFGALLLRKCAPRTLTIIAAVLYLFPIPFVLGFAALDPTADWTTPSWSSIAAAASSGPATTAPSSAPASGGASGFPSAAIQFLQFLDREASIYQSGSFREVIGLRASYFVLMNLYAMPFLYLWLCLPLFLLGIAAVKRNLFSTGRATHTRWILVAGLFIAGLGLEIYADRSFGRDAHQAWPAASMYVLSYLGSPMLSASYALIILGLAARPALQRLSRPVAALGRMALTNYLMHSVLAGLIFYSHGLGLFGTMGSASLFGIACAILAGQLVLSPIWLRHYQFGPVEWLWRTATYGKAQPMRRAAGSVPGG